MIGEPVEERGGHLGIAEHAGPFGESEIGGDDHRGLCIELADQMEQQLATRTAICPLKLAFACYLCVTCWIFRMFVSRTRKIAKPLT